MTNTKDTTPVVVSLPTPVPPVSLVYVCDKESEGVLRQCLGDIGVTNVEFNRGSVKTAITDLGKRTSPRLLIVDISGVEDPALQLNHLAEVCEPGTGVIVIGNTNDITLYREFKNIGVVEYFFKPLMRDLVVRACNGILTGTIDMTGSRTGKLVFVVGIDGGVGATTIATNTAWLLAEAYQRPVMLVDLDLHSGDAALQLDVKPNEALREALEHPERVDDLFIERGVIRVTNRLNLLSSLEPFDNTIIPEEKAVLSLLETLLRRYRYVFVDMPLSLMPQIMNVMYLPSICLMVSNSSLTAARDVVRCRDKFGPNTPERSMLHIFNGRGSSSGLPEADFVRAIGKAPDIIIPFDSKIGEASRMGIMEVKKVASLQRALLPIIRLLTGKGAETQPTFLERLFG